LIVVDDTIDQNEIAVLAVTTRSKKIALELVSSRPGDDGRRSLLPQGLPLRLMIIDPRSLTRHCLVAALEAGGGFEQIIAVSSVTEAVEALAGAKAPDAVVLNLASDPFVDDGLRNIVNAIREVAPTSGIVMLTAHAVRSHATIALRVGVQGFLDSDTSLETTIEAIRFVARGWMIYPGFEYSPDAQPLGDAPVRDLPSMGFTMRQLQVLDGLEQGLTNGAIATTLQVSERTIKAHVKEIMRRVGASNRTQVVAMMSRMTRSPPVRHRSTADVAGSIPFEHSEPAPL